MNVTRRLATLFGVQSGRRERRTSYYRTQALMRDAVERGPIDMSSQPTDLLVEIVAQETVKARVDAALREIYRRLDIDGPPELDGGKRKELRNRVRALLAHRPGQIGTGKKRRARKPATLSDTLIADDPSPASSAAGSRMNGGGFKR